VVKRGRKVSEDQRSWEEKKSKKNHRTTATATTQQQQQQQQILFDLGEGSIELSFCFAKVLTAAASSLIARSNKDGRKEG